jgi:uncharacterized membrane protein required for colicin V production
MNLNPLDIIIFAILIFFTISGLNSKFISSIKTTINLIGSIFISSFILESANTQFNLYFLNNPIVYLSMFILILIITSLLIGFLLDFAIYQLEDPDLDLNADRGLGALIGLVKGFVITALMIFIFDTTPLSAEVKEKISRKMEVESFFFKPCSDLKEMIFD